MTLTYWNGLADGAAGALLGVLAMLFCRDMLRSHVARFGLLLVLGGMSYLVVVSQQAVDFCAWWLWPMRLLGFITPGLFWLFAASWFDDDFVPGYRHLLALLLLAAIGIAHTRIFPRESIAFIAAILLFHIINICFVLMGLWAALRGRDADLVEARRRTRLALAAGVGIVIIMILGGELGLRQWPPPPDWQLVITSLLALMAAVIIITVTSWRDASLMAAPVRQSIAQPTGVPELDDGPLLHQIETLMRQERLYRGEGVTITQVAARLSVPEYRLRRAINGGLGARNFNAYLNGYRLEEACAALADPDQREVPILTIALDAGFGSLASFNRIFKRETGVTPSEFRLSSRESAR